VIIYIVSYTLHGFNLRINDEYSKQSYRDIKYLHMVSKAIFWIIKNETKLIRDKQKWVNHKWHIFEKKNYNCILNWIKWMSEIIYLTEPIISWSTSQHQRPVRGEKGSKNLYSLDVTKFSILVLGNFKLLIPVKTKIKHWYILTAIQFLLCNVIQKFPPDTLGTFIGAYNIQTYIMSKSYAKW